MDIQFFKFGTSWMFLVLTYFGRFQHSYVTDYPVMAMNVLFIVSLVIMLESGYNIVKQISKELGDENL